MTFKNSNLHEENEERVELESLPEDKGRGKFITQGFLIKVKDCDVRIRKLELPNGDIEYTMTAKYRPDNQEAEVEISQEIFDTLFPNTSSKQQKMRYKIDGWDVDQFADGHVVAEYEFGKNEKSTEIPEDWETKDQIDEIVKSAHWINGEK